MTIRGMDHVAHNQSQEHGLAKYDNSTRGVNKLTLTGRGELWQRPPNRSCPVRASFLYISGVEVLIFLVTSDIYT
jgi:hypothetical protein